MTGLWFLPKPAFGLNTNNDDDIYTYISFRSVAAGNLLDIPDVKCEFFSSCVKWVTVTKVKGIQKMRLMYMVYRRGALLLKH